MTELNSPPEFHTQWHQKREETDDVLQDSREQKPEP